MNAEGLVVNTVYMADAGDLAKAGVDALAAAVNRAILKKGVAVLAIPGGRSVSGMWALLADERRIEWKKVQVFMVDERIVPPTHDDSNYKLAYDSFLGKLIHSGKLPVKNVHPFAPNDSDDKGSCIYYEELKKFGGKAAT